jgi:hypothetical protein
MSVRAKLIFSLLLVTTVTDTCAQQQHDQTFRSPQHDVRVMVDISFVQQVFSRFYNLNYGDTIRLGEFGCGDPLFLVNLNEPVRLTAKGAISQSGEYHTDLQVSTGLNAKIHETCFGLNQPSVGGTGFLAARLGPVSNLSEIPLNGSFSIGALATVLGLTFPIKSTINSPVKLDSLPISLEDNTLGDSLDFVQYQGGEWKVTDSPKKKQLPVFLNGGSFGDLGNFPEGTPRGNSRLVIDGTFGQAPQYMDFSGPNAAVQQNQDFTNDSPIPDLTTNSAPNVGVSLSDGFVGHMRPDGGAGFLGQLLPIQISGERDVHILWFKRRYRFQVVLNGAESAIEETPDHQLRDIRASLSSTYATLQSVRSQNGTQIVGPKKFVHKIAASATFDRLSFDADKSAITFRVADFSVKIFAWWFVIPFKLSAGQLEQSLNHGSISVASILNKFPIGFDECVNTNYDKFKSWAGASCDPADPNVQVIGYLSWTPRPDSNTNYQYNFQIDPKSIHITRGKSHTYISMAIVDAKP